MPASVLDDHDLPVVPTMPAAVTIATAKFGAGAFAVLDDDLVGPSVMFATAFDHDLLGAGDRRGRDGNRGNGRGNDSKLLHDVASPPVKWRENIQMAAKVPTELRENSEQIFRFFSQCARFDKTLTRYSTIA